MVSRTVCSIVCGVIGLVLLVTGCVFIAVFAQLIHKEVNDELPLKTGSTSYDNWETPPVPIYFQVWMYDVVNYLEVAEGQKPSVIQRGPYTYREKRHKVNVTFRDDNTVSYREQRTFFFRRDMSAGPENDTFHGLNLPMLTLIEMVKTSQFSALEPILDLILKASGEKLFIEMSVKDLMWGYKDKLFTEANKLTKQFHINISIPEEFGLFYGQNGTDDGVYKINDGQGNLDTFAEILSWNGEKELSFWTTKEANSINGSDGTMYPPFIDTSKTKYLFSSDICRSLGMEHSGSVTERGIKMERFVAPEILFGNVTVNPDNAGFCTPAGNCLPSGLLNVSVCRQGAPIVMSMPNFLGCDKDVIDSIQGIHPNKDDFQSHLDIEPMTGVVMNAGKKLQINVVLEKTKGIPETQNIEKRIYFPIMWLNESALIDVKDANDFKTDVLDKLKLLDGIKYALIALGSFLIVIAVGLFVKMKMTQRNELPQDDRKKLFGGSENGHVQENNQEGEVTVTNNHQSTNHTTNHVDT